MRDVRALVDADNEEQREAPECRILAMRRYASLEAGPAVEHGDPANSDDAAAAT